MIKVTSCQDMVNHLTQEISYHQLALNADMEPATLYKVKKKGGGLSAPNFFKIVNGLGGKAYIGAMGERVEINTNEDIRNIVLNLYDSDEGKAALSEATAKTYKSGTTPTMLTLHKMLNATGYGLYVDWGEDDWSEDDD